MIRASTPSVRRRAGEPEHLALHAAESDSEYGHDNITRTRVPPTRESSQGNRAVPSMGDPVAGPVRLQQVPVLGLPRISSSKRWARSWVTRATSSRRRPVALGRRSGRGCTTS